MASCKQSFLQNTLQEIGEFFGLVLFSQQEANHAKRSQGCQGDDQARHNKSSRDQQKPMQRENFNKTLSALHMGRTDDKHSRQEHNSRLKDGTRKIE